MTISVIQTVTHSQATGPTNPVSITVSAGSYLAVHTVNNAQATASCSGISDGTSSYSSALQNIADTVDGWREQLFVTTASVSGGTYTVTASFTGSPGFSGIAVTEIAGSSGLLTSAGLYQANVGTGTDAITSGVLGTLSAVPALILGVTAQTNIVAAVTSAGTGFGGGAVIWSGLYSNFGYIENRRVTVNTSIAATFTQGTGAVWRLTIGSAWQEYSLILTPAVGAAGLSGNAPAEQQSFVLTPSTA